MLNLIIKILLYLCAFVAIVMFTPGSILLDISPKPYHYSLPKEFFGALKENHNLTHAEKVFVNNIVGPESLATYKGKLVTGAEDGFIYQIDGNSLKRLIRLVGNTTCLQCRCGRPTGMAFDSRGTLYVVDPDCGVFSVSHIFSAPKLDLVLSTDATRVLGKASKFLNDLTIDNGGGLNGGNVLYISDVSTKFNFQEIMLSIGGSDTGRIIKFDVNANKVDVIADGLLLPNGVEITDDKSAIMFSEYIARRIHRHHIRGPKAGLTEVLVSSLPGEPDNIRRSALNEETYWVGITSARDSSKPNELDYYLKRPLLRKLVCRLLHAFGITVENVGHILSIPYLQKYGFDIRTGRITSNILYDRTYGLAIEMNKNGDIINSLHAPDGSVAFISEAREVRLSHNETVLYLGSYINNYIAKYTLYR